MRSEYSCAFTARAEQDLDEILGYIKNELKNPDAAARFGQKVFRCCDTLCAQPEAGMFVENEYLTDKQVRRILVENYIVYYKAAAEEKTVYILRIVYGYRNLDAVLSTIE